MDTPDRCLRRAGFRLTNYAPEAQCTPTRSALLTGRHAIRCGNHSVPLGAPGGWGLVAWEQTLGDLLSGAGYGCAVYGKWHVGEGTGRWPTDKGFEEWYGPPRTYDECLWPDDPWYDPQRDPVSRMVEIRQGERDVTDGDQLTLDVRRDCDREYLRRATAFIRAKAGQGVPFFVYFNHSLMHMPVIPRAEFKGQTGQGDWADSLLELDTDFGTLLDLLDELDLADSTLVVFAGDNGPEEVLLWRGTPDYWEGSYFAGGEGNLRTPCIVRWPGRIPGGQVSDDIMHVTDWFTTLLHAAGVAVPADRVIDGVNQLDWLGGAQAMSLRDGYIDWMGPEIYGVKWRNFKLALVEQKYSTDPVGKLSSPRIINLIADPQEREPLNLPYMHSWTATHFNRLLAEFQASIKREPPSTLRRTPGLHPSATTPLTPPPGAHRHVTAEDGRVLHQRAWADTAVHPEDQTVPAVTVLRGCSSPSTDHVRAPRSWTPPARAAVLDCETMPFVDVTATRMLNQLAADLYRQGCGWSSPPRSARYAT